MHWSTGAQISSVDMQMQRLALVVRLRAAVKNAAQGREKFWSNTATSSDRGDRLKFLSGPS
jgi:hypothetical protein